MRIRFLILSAAAAAASLAAGDPGLALEVKLQAVETEKVARSPAAITSGVPFARGEVKDVARFSVSAGGKPLPAQFAATV